MMDPDDLTTLLAEAKNLAERHHRTPDERVVRTAPPTRSMTSCQASRCSRAVDMVVRPNH